MIADDTAHTNEIQGVKGSDCYLTTGKEVLDLSIMANRGLEPSYITEKVQAIIASKNMKDLEDLVVLAFHIRDVRGGKGERDIFYHLLPTLPRTLGKATLALVPEYGCWSDLVKKEDVFVNFKDSILDIVQKQWRKDWALYETYIAALALWKSGGETGSAPNKPSISLLAGHLPRQDKATSTEMVSAFAYAITGSVGKKGLTIYRKRCSVLTPFCRPTESRLCAKNFEDLVPSEMPGRALQKYTKALLNKPVPGEHGRKVPSTDPDRIALAERFAEHFARAARGEAKVKGADTVFPHELVKKVWLHHKGASILSVDELNAIEAQWNSIVAPFKASGRLGRMVAMSDLSSSMEADHAFVVSLALGLIIAECNTGHFRDSLFTFHTDPTFHRFTTRDLVSRVAECMALPWGGSTDFQKCYNLMLDQMTQARVLEGEEPTDLVCLTDMGFDSAVPQDYGYAGRAGGEHETHFQILQKAWVSRARTMAQNWRCPRLVCWNLRAQYKDFQATAREEGVVMISGWSPSMLKALITSGFDAFTPAAMLRAILDAPRYDAIRKAIAPLFDTTGPPAGGGPPGSGPVSSLEAASARAATGATTSDDGLRRSSTRDCGGWRDCSCGGCFGGGPPPSSGGGGGASSSGGGGGAPPSSGGGAPPSSGGGAPPSSGGGAPPYPGDGYTGGSYVSTFSHQFPTHIPLPSSPVMARRVTFNPEEEDDEEDE
jgi:hypothetical protein